MVLSVPFWDLIESPLRHIKISTNMQRVLEMNTTVAFYQVIHLIGALSLSANILFYHQTETFWLISLRFHLLSPSRHSIRPSIKVPSYNPNKNSNTIDNFFMLVQKEIILKTIKSHLIKFNFSHTYFLMLFIIKIHKQSFRIPSVVISM